MVVTSFRMAHAASAESRCHPCTNMSQHCGNGNCANLPSTSLSTSIRTRRRSRPRTPSNSSGGLRADLAMACVKPMWAVRRAGRNTKMTIKESNGTAAAAVMNFQQPGRVQSTATRKLIRNTATTHPSMIDIILQRGKNQKKSSTPCQTTTKSQTQISLVPPP